MAGASSHDGNTVAAEGVTSGALQGAHDAVRERRAKRHGGRIRGHSSPADGPAERVRAPSRDAIAATVAR